MSTYSTCIFCGRNDSKPSREDVLPRWIAREFPGNDPWHVHNFVTGKTFKTHKQLGIISKRPCGRCNNGWMSHLESQSKPILAPLMHGQHATLSVAEQLLIARWLIKTSIMYDLHYEKTRECYFTPTECQSIMNGLAFPPFTLIFLARYIGEKNEIVTREAGFEFDPNKLPKAQHNLLDFEAYTASFAIKHLALQVFSFRRPKDITNDDLAVEIPDIWGGVDVQIWPPSGNPVAWPPRLFLDDDGFEMFSNRWGDMGLLAREPPP